MGEKRKSMPPDVSRKIWVKAGGRCEYEGCNKLLYKDSLTEKEMNTAYIAHIIAVSPDGPRGDLLLSPKLELDLSNLMLMCDECHRRIDKEQVKEHTIDRLVEMKKKHEQRIESVTGLHEENKSHIIIYTARVGNFEVEVSFDQATSAMMPEKFPSNDRPVFLGIKNGIEHDHTQEYWTQQLRQLEGSFNKNVLPLIDHDPVKSFSVFAFAPQPLLIKLGTLLSDKYSIRIFQYHRHNSSWRWGNTSTEINYLLKTADRKTKIPALIFSLSGSIDKTSVYSSLGNDCSIWEITIDSPFNDFLRTPDLLMKFKEITRRTIEQIKQIHGSSPLHIFPAMPVSAAVELGRLWMPKADMPMIIYDHNNKNRGFAKAIEIKNN